MNAYTKGPWILGEIRNHDVGGGEWRLACINVIPPGDYRGEICYLQSAEHIRGISAVEAEANARLIAAAPDLLDALEAAIECGMVPTSTAKEGGATAHARQVHVADQIRAAIAKARGEA